MSTPSGDTALSTGITHVKVSPHLHSLDWWCSVVHRQRHFQRQYLYLPSTRFQCLDQTQSWVYSISVITKQSSTAPSWNRWCGWVWSSAARHWSLLLTDNSREVCSRAKRDTVSVEHCWCYCCCWTLFQIELALPSSAMSTRYSKALLLIVFPIKILILHKLYNQISIEIC